MSFKVHQLLMYRYWREAAALGLTTLSTPPEKYFGFTAFDIDVLHFSKAGEGRGVWFRLLDGRVIDECGMACDPDAALYDATIN